MAKVDYTALVQQVEISLAAISFTGGFEHQPKMPAGGVSTDGTNHELRMKARGGGLLARYLTTLADGSISGDEVNLVYEFLEQSPDHLRQLVAAVKTLQGIVANQEQEIAKSQKAFPNPAPPQNPAK